ncbi:MAG: hypothetical protein AB7G11_05240 [Phycisphaerales bacterium]
MFLKVAVTILSLGLTAAGLLAVRQLRLQAIHDSALIQRRIAEHDRLLWKLRGDIAVQLTPQRIKQMSDQLGPLVHIAEPPSASTGDMDIAGQPAPQTPAVPRRP